MTAKLGAVLVRHRHSLCSALAGAECVSAQRQPARSLSLLRVSRQGVRLCSVLVGAESVSAQRQPSQSTSLLSVSRRRFCLCSALVGAESVSAQHQPARFFPAFSVNCALCQPWYRVHYFQKNSERKQLFVKLFQPFNPLAQVDMIHEIKKCEKIL